MKLSYKILFFKFILLINFFSYSSSYADNHNIYEILEKLQKDIKTLEKAVYSGSIKINDENINDLNSSNNSEDVLTRHLLKLSEIENQFQQLTNKFEEINFKLDKLSNRMSKVQADNQIRFQDLESGLLSGDSTKKMTKKTCCGLQNWCQNHANTLPSRLSRLCHRIFPGSFPQGGPLCTSFPATALQPWQSREIRIRINKNTSNFK